MTKPSKLTLAPDVSQVGFSLARRWMSAAVSSGNKAVPYGIYDLAANTGWANVGTDHDTVAFAVESIRRWWHGQGQVASPQATRLLITADAGGSNGYRTRSWKLELAQLAAETGLTSPCATCRPEHRSGTRSSTGCSHTSP